MHWTPFLTWLEERAINTPLPVPKEPSTCLLFHWGQHRERYVSVEHMMDRLLPVLVGWDVHQRGLGRRLKGNTLLRQRHLASMQRKMRHIVIRWWIEWDEATRMTPFDEEFLIGTGYEPPDEWRPPGS